MTTIPSTAFHWDKAASQFWQEVSTLAHQYQFSGTSIALTSRYDDRVIHFRMDRIDRDAEGEIVAWHFSPYLPGDGSRAPFSILILND